MLCCFTDYLKTFPTPSLRIRINFRDLGSLNTDTAHQPLLIEDKGIDALLQRRRRQIFAEARIQHYQARSGPQLKASAVVEISERIIVHEKQHVAKRLGTSLKTVRRSQ